MTYTMTSKIRKEKFGNLFWGIFLHVERVEIGRGCSYIIYQLQEIAGVLNVLYNTNNDIV